MQDTSRLYREQRLTPYYSLRHLEVPQKEIRKNSIQETLVYKSLESRYTRVEKLEYERILNIRVSLPDIQEETRYEGESLFLNNRVICVRLSGRTETYGRFGDAQASQGSTPAPSTMLRIASCRSILPFKERDWSSLSA